MNVKVMKVLNSISGLSFGLSSVSLLVIPFIKFGQELPIIAYVVAFFFWLGLILGLILQVIIAINCKKLSLKNDSKKHRLLYIISAGALAVVVILSVFNSKNIFFFTISLFLLLLSLQAAVVIKREGCLK
ncbi:MAG: hypothetical protein U0L18_08325 [Acutalibacteraceae bacterium]|nr:hypothetical protein [Acutalibacteraceae bacterium]